MEIGRYRIVRTLGRGGTAEVLEAQAEGAGGFSRRVAIKRLLPEHASEPAYARMFLDEARIASALHHANIVSVIDYGIADGRPFQVLQYVDGIDAGRLAERALAKGHRLPVALVLHVCTEIAHALHHAHTARGDDGSPLGVVHRDVSPANILVSWGGEVHLADFGIAFAKDRSERTADGIAKGTPMYCAPEQLTGGVVDPRTDVFSLGATCHRLLCGRSPLAGDHALGDLLAGRPLPIDPAIDEDVAEVLRSALAPDRSARHADAAALASALGTALARRIDRDPRSLLRGFLDEIHDVAAPPQRGKLDALLGVGLELVAVGEQDGVRNYESRTTDVAAAGPGAARRRRRGWLALPIAFGIVALAWGWPRGDRPNPHAALRMGWSVRITPLSPVVPTPLARAEVPPSEPPPPRADEPSPRPRRSPGTKPRADPSTAAAGAPPPTATATIEVGGAPAVNAEIRVDGKSMGYAPRRLVLPVGPHDIVLLDKAGKKVASTRVELTARHTAKSPKRWILKDG